MRLLLLVPLAAALHAAVIRGTVVENATGNALARAVVILQPISGTPGDTRSMRTTRFGGFEFDRLAAGAYVLKASRRGFLAMEYGQKRWNSAGAPVLIEENETAFLNIRLSRFGSIGGTLLDENDIGLPGHDVVAYRNTRPLALVTETTTDDRGEYRLHGLEPGTYLVRTAGKHYEEGDYIPTFAKETEKSESAQTVEVFLDQQTAHVDVRPIAGPTFTLSVMALTAPPAPVTLTFASELGRKTLHTSYFRFTGLPPGNYELYAQAPVDPSSGAVIQAADTVVQLAKDTEILLQLMPIRPVGITISGGPRADAGQIWIRRKDLAGTTAPEKIEPIDHTATLLPGTWEAWIDPPPGYYAAGFTGPGVFRLARTRADGWNEYIPNRYAGLRFTLSPAVGSVRGAVKSAGDPAGGAPVYLETWDTVNKVRIGELRVTRTDPRGQYSFVNLTPGPYRVLSTFEYLAPDSATMESAGSSVSVEGHADAVRDLELYVIR